MIKGKPKAEPFVVVVCCRDIQSIEDVVHAEPSVDPSVSRRALSWNPYP
ncbi:unnamed protein product [Brassica oleracea var. botrytis]